MDTVFELGGERLVLKDDVITVAKAREIRAAMKDLVKKNDEEVEELKKVLVSIDEKYSDDLTKGENETDESYKERIAPILEAKKAEADAVIPEDKESVVMEMAYKCLGVLADQFGQSAKVTPANFEAAKNYNKVKLQLAKFLINNECEIGVLFLPPKNLN